MIACPLLMLGIHYWSKALAKCWTLMEYNLVQSWRRIMAYWQQVCCTGFYVRRQLGRNRRVVILCATLPASSMQLWFDN